MIVSKKEINITNIFQLKPFQDRVIFQATEDEETLKYFYLSADTGIIRVKQPLTGQSQVGYRVRKLLVFLLSCWLWHL